MKGAQYEEDLSFSMQKLYFSFDKMEAIKISKLDQILEKLKVIILDMDGTLMNGKASIPGVAKTVYKLLIDESKIVLFYTNGGYSTV